MGDQCFHVAVFKNGKLTDERFAPLKGGIVLGRDARFTFERRRPILHIAEGVEGEIRVDGTSRYRLPERLELPDRAQIILSDRMLCTQLITRPRPPPTSALPPGVRPGFLGGLERRLLRVLTGVFVAELSFFLFVNHRPDLTPDAAPMETPFERIATIVLSKKDPPPPPKQASEKPSTPGKQVKKKVAGKAPASHDEAAKEAIASSPLLKVLGAVNLHGPLNDVLKPSDAFGHAVADAFDDMKDIRFANGDDVPSHRGIGDPRGPIGIGNFDPGPGGGSRPRIAEHLPVPVVPKIEINPDEIEVPAATVDKDKLRKFIQLRLPGIQHCYERELKVTPSLRGKITMRFTITPDGHTGDCGVDDDTLRDDNVSSCVSQIIRAWNYPFRPPEEAPVTFPFLFQPGG